MRARVAWMNEADDAILEYLQELETETGHRIALPPTAVWYNLVEELAVLDRSQNTISRRMNVLSDAGLLEKTDEKRGYYRLTDRGSSYLDGDLEASALEDPDSN
ncbi:winged helix-turn-helix domain-containing protein [Natronolimnohabitans sp. A-GB9]|uniref:winged helix-turn-helix domain-containing protein n=1 Tax=Natronolimnohabitans sp. A-GB9 TaxID=3069757 RepID=UPI0027B6F359|nr:winged helix-turn-helix domain-containing protein [Natronolimnohabitans sp. A-GB9]MDQ2049342.1 winged helix-turn-helix domain-containing protein [Natronolimnohabitans sp. A-GB9]